MTKTIVIGVSVIAALLLGYATVQQAGFGIATGPTHRQIEQFVKGLVIGERGTEAKNFQFGTCTLATNQLALEATSSDDFYCAATGVKSGDNVSINLPSNNGTPWGGFLVDYAKASTTDGYITVGITNLTGGATSSFPLATTSVQYRAYR